MGPILVLNKSLFKKGCLWSRGMFRYQWDGLRIVYCLVSMLKKLRPVLPGLKGSSSAEKRLSFINENQSLHCEYMFLVRILKLLIGKMLNSMNKSPSFYSI